MTIWQWNGDRKEWEGSPVGPEGAALAGGRARVVHLPQGGCALLSRGGASVNGVAPLPLMVLADRDEIQLRGSIYYFAGDGIAEAAPFRAQGKKIRCARCQGVLEENAMTVRCPACRTHHHENCWRYAQAPGCQKCKHPAERFAWVPEPPV